MDNNKDTGHFQRKMQARHVIMLSLGGVIGTGLFLSSGYTIQQTDRHDSILPDWSDCRLSGHALSW